MTAGWHIGTTEGRVGRYILDDLVAHTAGSHVWRASDPALNRPVAARLLPLSDPRSAALRAAARQAASVRDRHVVQVLDVVETDTQIAVITEWVRGRTWNEVLSEEWPHEEVTLVALELARALISVRSAGAHHGRIRPTSLVITDTNEVRLRGVGVDAALHGISPGTSAERADLHGVGAVLYSGLTGRWPGPSADPGSVEGVPLATPVGGVLPAPGELTAGVPKQLSRIAMRCLTGVALPKRTHPYTDLDQAEAALARAVDSSSAPGSAAAPPGRTRRRLALAAAAVGALTATVVLATLLQPSGEGPGSTPALTQPSVAGDFADVGLRPLPIAAAVDFDPYGNDGKENPDAAPLAVDGNGATAWTTVRYKNSDMRPKAGTGLVVDLGIKRPISEVQVQLVGSGTDLELRYGDTPAGTDRGFDLLAEAVGAGSRLTLRLPAPVETRYLLVWLTNLPYGDGIYQGGIREVRVLG